MLVMIKPSFSFYLPNTFSPNGDGRNDIFRPYGTGWDLDTYSMRIYSRWGKLVFSTTDVSHGWDGKLDNGTEAQQEVYTVMVFINGLDGSDHNYTQGLGLIR
ncbi:hypothetical protein SDC9_69849 [bioreactor metagenome]|uniref:Gliding motility-associated C-terminal domain-containing protein n=1 Tax=bioreactor metagenome TaxID=1076179 RepID=A0A644Y595_9ZZZZ